MDRFKLERVTISDVDGIDREYAVIRDCYEDRKIEGPGGVVETGRGFVRAQGRQYVGDFGRGSAVYAGNHGDVYYSPVAFCDGEWSHSRPNNQGVYLAVTDNAATGKLFAALEDFTATNGVGVVLH